MQGFELIPKHSPMRAWVSTMATSGKHKCVPILEKLLVLPLLPVLVLDHLVIRLTSNFMSDDKSIAFPNTL
jgi:hypothetical protein